MRRGRVLIMFEMLVALVVFAGLTTAALGCLVLHERLHERFRQDDTNTVVRLAANIFVVMTSLVFALLINSTKNTFEAIDRNVHAFATELVLLDEALRQLGPDAGEARRKLAAYVDQAVRGTWGFDGTPQVDDVQAGELLAEVGRSLAAITPASEIGAGFLRDAQHDYRIVVKRRWSLVQESDGTIPPPLIGMLVAWLVLVFASFGYRAPRNTVVVTTLVVSAALISGSLYLVLDMNVPFAGPVQISPEPLLRVAEQIRR
jgi:hypothetical protein